MTDKFLKFKLSTKDELVQYAGTLGELVVLKDNMCLFVMDGTTKGGFPVGKGTGKTYEVAHIPKRIDVYNEDYAAGSKEELIAYIQLTATRTVILPEASITRRGLKLKIIDDTGNCSATKQIVVNPVGGDTINNSNYAVPIISAYGYLIVTCDGISKWTIVGRDIKSELASVGTTPPSAHRLWSNNHVIEVNTTPPT